MNRNDNHKNSGSGLISCDEIREQLPAYMLRELGEKQSRLVHEHLRLCDDCRHEAARFERMEALLREHKEASPATAPVLNEKRLARLRFAALHPVFDWMYFRHRLVSALCAILLILLVVFFLRNAAFYKEESFEDSIPIWRMFRSGQLPELVEEAARLQREQEGLGREGPDPTGEMVP